MIVPTKTKGGHPITNFKKLPAPIELEHIEATYCGTVDVKYFGDLLIFWDDSGNCNNPVRIDLFIEI